MGQAFKLPRFQAGQPLLDQLTADRLNTMLAAIESNRTIVGVNMTGNWSPSGTVVRASPQSPPGKPEIFSFLMEDKSTVVGGSPVYKVLIHDGSANGVLITGMGADDFTLTVGGDGYKVYLIITFDPNDLTILSRSIDQGATVPVSTLTALLGTLYIQIGYVVVEAGTLTPVNTVCGDVNFDLVYGVVNAAPALFVSCNYGVIPLAVP